MARLDASPGPALTAWVGVRALSLGMIPGAEAYAFDCGSGGSGGASATAIPPLVATEFAPIEPVAPEQAYPPGYPAYAAGYR